jgi:hypothetical protein
LQRGGDDVHLGFVQVRRDLHKHRHAALVLPGQGLPALRHCAQQRVQRLVALQRAQVLGVGAG